MLAFLVCGMPYLMPTPTRGKAASPPFAIIYLTREINAAKINTPIPIFAKLSRLWNAIFDAHHTHTRQSCAFAICNYLFNPQHLRGKKDYTPICNTLMS